VDFFKKSAFWGKLFGNRPGSQTSLLKSAIGIEVMGAINYPTVARYSKVS
jgi:hypothetical protein